ncbi:LolA family protein [Alicyclobacillus mengziensis]|uniref:Outer membrane lipoprotein carrier protein LolA n=1 Tax=Alicyclobacillus mengziensis TaxID=2931921 RepID=A0A9X7Z766_9BACL|nr:outer membrane lipoprotein carrier protein LolA [Alicyclobacillus mengziensis]QSO47000.1 outer membrane lipoprotein carrier protein LolA [Alicyclobacillus mengziensis]
MRKVTGFILAMGLAVGLVAGCGTPSTKNVVSKLQTQAEELDATNYQSTAKMTVQMDSGSQTYYIVTSYDSPNTYKIALGDSNQQINQIIVRNPNGMFIVSPSLQKVFRFNGNWAQNQGHIYLYDQILQQIVNSKNVKMAKSGNNLTFTMPVTSQNDVVTTQKVELAQGTFAPKKVVLLNKQDQAVVTIDFQTFKQGVKFTSAEFDPQKLASSGTATKTTMASTSQFGYIEPLQTLGDKLDLQQPQSAEDMLMRYSGPYGFTLEEWRPSAGVAGLPSAQLVDLYGVPGILSGSGNAHQLTWLNNGVEFSLTSSKMTLNQMREVAMSTFGQVGK